MRLPEVGEVTFQHNSQEVWLHAFIDDHITRQIEKTRTFYEIEMLDYIASLGRFETVIDVGANIGNHAVYFGMFVADQVVAFEPHRPVYDLLKTNISNNDLGAKITPCQSALGQYHGFVGMSRWRWRNIGSAHTEEGGDIKIQRLDDYCGVSDIKNISLIKVDVEGSDESVLRGAADILSNYKPEVFVEARSRKQRQRIHELLVMAHGYRYVRTFRGAPMHYYTAE